MKFDTFTEVPVSLVLFSLICIDIVERIRHCRLTGQANELVRNADIPSAVLTRVEPVNPIIAAATGPAPATTAAAATQTTAQNGNQNGIGPRLEANGTVPGLPGNQDRTFTMTSLNSRSGLQNVPGIPGIPGVSGVPVVPGTPGATVSAFQIPPYAPYSGPLRFLLASDARAEVFVDSFLFWMDTAEMVRVAGNTYVCFSGWVLPIYIFSFLSTLRLTDSSSFLIYNDAHNKCVKAVSSSVVVAAPCDPSSDNQRFRWVSSSRLLSISLKLCLGAQDLKDWVKVLLVPCNELSPLQAWECKNETLFGLKGQALHFNYGNKNEKNVMVYKGSGTWSRWQIYGSNVDLCSHGYEEMFTIGGNAFGRPCQFPFKFGEEWYAECTLAGRSDGQLWCSTETDYNTEKKWGFCPSKSSAVGWDSDPVTGVLYQRNTQSVLTWHQARKSCQQQGADLLSIVELHEQTYISGLINHLGTSLWTGLNSLEFQSGWQWSNGNPFRYLNWAPGHPSLEPGLNCAAMNAGKASKWESKECSKKLGYICRKGNSTSITPVVGKEYPSFCPPGWIPYMGHCYSLQRTKKLWSDALAACRKDEADLASIHNIEEHSFIISQCGYLATDELWIGLNDQRIQNLFEWSDRSHVTFAKWQAGEPSHTSNLQEDCVLIKGKDGKFADDMCEKQYGYLCKKKASSKPDGAPEVVSAGCPPGWIRYSWYCYNIGVEIKTFDEAKQACEESQAMLVNVAHRYENAFLISLIGLRPEKYFWIGMSNTLKADRFQYSNGEKVKFTHFNVGMPDRHQGCVAMLTGESAGLWDVLSCNSKQKYICKKLAEGVTTTAVPPTTRPLKCASGWDRKDSSYCIKVYRKSKEKQKTWFEAHSFCNAIGGELASFHSDAEVNSLSYAGSNPAWIGFSFQGTGSGFVWSDESPSDYENWSFGEPNNYNDNEHCAETSFYYGHLWNDRDCEAYNDWICQIRLGTTPKPPPTAVTIAEYNVTEDGWIQYNGSQYFINQDELSMDEARAYCKQNHGDLVVISGHTERRFLWKQIVRGSENQYYIGMTVGLDKSFSWVDGSPVVFTAWDQNEPNFANNDENCVTIYKSMGFWNDINCGVPLPSICERGSNFVNTTLAPTMVPKGGCAPEWITFQGKCYRFVSDEKPWHSARDYCIAQGGNLVSILNQQEQAFLISKMLTFKDDLWIGLNDVNWEMRFLWTDGKGVGFTNWAKGHPVSLPHDRTSFTERSYDCVIMVRNPERITGHWKVESCGRSAAFICKRNIDSQILPPPTTASPGMFFMLGNDSYKLQLERMTWDEARRQCKADDADLASIRDSISQAFTLLRMGAVKEPVWIGLNSNQTGGWYRWVDNWSLLYSNWATGEPKKNLACVYIDTGGVWKTGECSSTYYSLCKRSPNIAPTEPPQHPGNCPEPKKRKTWIPFRGHCYAFIASSTENWAHATVECMRMGASLVSVEDPLESGFIQKNLEILQDGTRSFWIGMHRNYAGDWLWIDNSVVDYTNWKSRAPSSSGDCVEALTESGLWRNTHCNSYKSYICKIAKVVPPTPKATEIIAALKQEPHSYAGIGIGVVLVIVAVVGLAVFLQFKRAPKPVEGECTFDNTLYFSSDPTRSTTTVDTKGLVANIEQNEHA
ncbi:macrophage mannose receptor 1 [Chanos chanos]|uniref:Macrophage mannose receptor 1 n=1 Tax=Chanos chanos TaxID=29144 RepID=A0A6J2VSV4_CHACN|nr:macrophage mannose receptor 1 [Chanos chanos]